MPGQFTLIKNGVIVLHIINGVNTPVPSKEWPLWAKTLKHFAKPEDNGIGDLVRRLIGEENSQAFKAWYKQTTGKDCGCNGRQTLWNQLYPL